MGGGEEGEEDALEKGEGEGLEGLGGAGPVFFGGEGLGPVLCGGGDLWRRGAEEGVQEVGGLGGGRRFCVEVAG